eukprot:tig00000444_g815.t1
MSALPRAVGQTLRISQKGISRIQQLVDSQPPTSRIHQLVDQPTQWFEDELRAGLPWNAVLVQSTESARTALKDSSDGSLAVSARPRTLSTVIPPSPPLAPIAIASLPPPIAMLPAVQQPFQLQPRSPSGLPAGSTRIFSAVSLADLASTLPAAPRRAAPGSSGGSGSGGRSFATGTRSGSGAGALAGALALPAAVAEEELEVEDFLEGGEAEIESEAAPSLRSVSPSTTERMLDVALEDLIDGCDDDEPLVGIAAALSPALAPEPVRISAVETAAEGRAVRRVVAPVAVKVEPAVVKVELSAVKLEPVAVKLERVPSLPLMPELGDIEEGDGSETREEALPTPTGSIKRRRVAQRGARNQRVRCAPLVPAAPEPALASPQEIRELSLEDLKRFMHLPINEAAPALGVCVTLLKKRVRELGVSRWPGRRIGCLEKIVGQLQAVLDAEVQFPRLDRDKVERVLADARRLRETPGLIYIENDDAADGAPNADELVKEFEDVQSRARRVLESAAKRGFTPAGRSSGGSRKASRRARPRTRRTADCEDDSDEAL